MHAMNAEIRAILGSKDADVSAPLFRKDPRTGGVRRSPEGAVVLDLQHLLVDPNNFSAVCSWCIRLTGGCVHAETSHACAWPPQTVENYFYFSFGVKDGLFGLGYDDDGMYTCGL